MTTLEQLRELRASLPNGKKDPWGKCCPNKRVLFNRAVKKGDFSQLTSGELGVVNEFLVHCKEVKKENKEFQKTIEKLAQQ